MATKKNNTKRDSTVQSVERALGLLEILADDEHGFRLTDIAQSANLSPSTTHRLLTTLEKKNFAQFDSIKGVWHVGRQAFAVGSSFVKRHNFVAPSIPFLRELRNKTKETANLGVLDNGEMITLAQVESREIMRAISQVGGRVPVTASGMGKALLSTFADEVAKDICARYPVKKFTHHTLIDPDKLEHAIARAKQVGYAIDDEEFTLGLRCVAAPVFNPQGEAFFAISISGLTSRVTPERVPAIGKIVKQTARELTEALGGKWPE